MKNTFSQKIDSAKKVLGAGILGVSVLAGCDLGKKPEQIMEATSEKVANIYEQKTEVLE